MLSFRLELVAITLTYFACITCVPADEQIRFSFYDWVSNVRQGLDPHSRLAAVNKKPKWPSHTYKGFRVSDKSFRIIWNVPTFQCHQHGLNFSQIWKWGMHQNYGDTFRGDKIALLYDPGWFPALLEANKGSDLVPRNGGVPQEGNISKHLEIFEQQIENKLIPDKNFAGLAIIDFEHWRPIWSENFGTLMPYRQLSRNIEQNKHPLWSSNEVEKEATKRFEKSAWQFFRRTLKAARRLRPQASWGYYGFPLCFNYTPKNQQATCSNSVQENNEKLKWLFEESSAIYPSLYFKKYGMSENTRALFMKGRMNEAMRVSYMSSTPTPVYAYTWFKYRDTRDFVSQNDLTNSLIIPRKEGAAGVIIWGSSNDVNTKQKCEALDDYVRTILGPTARHILQSSKDEIYTLFGNNIVEKPGTTDVEGNNVDYPLIL